MRTKRMHKLVFDGEAFSQFKCMTLVLQRFLLPLPAFNQSYIVCKLQITHTRTTREKLADMCFDAQCISKTSKMNSAKKA